MKFYGEVLEVVEGSNGFYFANCKDLNKNENVTLCSLVKKNDFAGMELKVKDKFASSLKDYKGKFYVIDGEPKRYDNTKKRTYNKKPKDDLAIRLGNAVSIATELGYNLSELACKASEEILPMVDDLRDELITENPEMDAYGLGARLGQCCIVVAKHKHFNTYNKDVYKTDVKKLFKRICDEELKLRNK